MKKDKASTLLPIYPGSHLAPQDLISREEFMRKWTDFAVRKPFIILVGSLANWDESYQDIDILVKAKDPTPLLEALDSTIVKMFDKKEEAIADFLISVQKFIASDSLFLNAKWRIERAFPEWEERIHVLDDAFSGPFTNFVELADLVAIAKDPRIRQEMDAKDQGCGKAWEVLFAEGIAVQYFEHEDHARAFADEIDKNATSRGFAKDVIHVNHSWVHRHSKSKRCYSVNRRKVHYNAQSFLTATDTQHEMAEKKLKLLTWFPMLKPLHGRQKGEIYSIDSVIETIKSRKIDWFKAYIAVQTKFDGVHCQAHKQGDEVRIWTEDGKEITKNCPSVIKDLASISHDFIFAGELELWKDKQHQNRAITAGILNTKETHPDEQFLLFNVFDCLYHDSKDIHMSEYAHRSQIYTKILPRLSHLKLAKTIIVKTEKELREAMEHFLKQEGSEGAYLKIFHGFPYLLTGKTLENIKFKNELSVEVQIVKVNLIGGEEKK